MRVRCPACDRGAAFVGLLHEDYLDARCDFASFWYPDDPVEFALSQASMADLFPDLDKAQLVREALARKPQRLTFAHCHVCRAVMGDGWPIDTQEWSRVE